MIQNLHFNGGKEYLEIKYPFISMSIKPGKPRLAFGTAPRSNDLMALIKLLRNRKAAQIQQPNPKQDANLFFMHDDSELLELDSREAYAQVGDYLISLLAHASLNDNEIQESRLPEFLNNITGRYELYSTIQQAPCYIQAEIKPHDIYLTFDVDFESPEIHWYSWGFEQEPEKVEKAFFWLLEELEKVTDAEWQDRVSPQILKMLVNMESSVYNKSNSQITPMQRALKYLTDELKYRASLHCGGVDWFGRMGIQSKEQEEAREFPVCMAYKAITDRHYKLSILIKKP